MPHPTPWIGFNRLKNLLETHKTTVLSGAGISTDSGIPDYRGPDTSATEHSPIRYDEFVMEPRTRQHYWARSAVGWPSFDAAKPNRGHHALSSLEDMGLINGLITQNVDRLHQAAGSGRVIELHGALEDVECLECGRYTSRSAVQERIMRLNPGWSRRAASLAPDGDAKLPRSATRDFQVPSCTSCSGVLKPDVVFFGEQVEASRVEDAWNLLDESEALLVTGSSLTVYSGFRFVRGCEKTDKPVGIINLGHTRGTPLSMVHVDGNTSEVLPQLVATCDAST